MIRAVAWTSDDGVKVARYAPAGRADLVGTLSLDCATLHPGLFSYPPSGRKCAGSASAVAHPATRSCAQAPIGFTLGSAKFIGPGVGLCADTARPVVSLVT